MTSEILSFSLLAFTSVFFIGLLIAAVAVELIAGGVKELLPYILAGAK